MVCLCCNYFWWISRGFGRSFNITDIFCVFAWLFLVIHPNRGVFSVCFSDGIIGWWWWRVVRPVNEYKSWVRSISMWLTLGMFNFLFCMRFVDTNFSQNFPAGCYKIILREFLLGEVGCTTTLKNIWKNIVNLLGYPIQNSHHDINVSKYWMGFPV